MTQWIIPITALLAGLTAITAGPAEAVVYCDYIGVPKGCVAGPGVALRPAPGAGAVGSGSGGSPRRGRRRGGTGGARRHTGEPRRPGQSRRAP